ncbi:MAG: type III-B CRISPR module-associated protein Cmr5 [Planctomycetes bacterium]|nr:type III-B CRISPR module-associated protein Cmr5 [Planctomycetota bacterium]
MTQAKTKSDHTVDQRRAAHAWEAIQRVKSDYDDRDRKEYGGHAKKLPIRIISAGLGQALAFLLAKANSPTSSDHKPHVKQVHDELTDWVVKRRPMTASDPDSLLQSVINGDSDFLRQATDEVLAYLQWLNRFAEAEGLTDEE